MYEQERLSWLESVLCLWYYSVTKDMERKVEEGDYWLFNLAIIVKRKKWRTHDSIPIQYTLGKTMDNPEPDMAPTCFYMDRNPQKIGQNIPDQECNLPPTISFNVETKM